MMKRILSVVLAVYKASDTAVGGWEYIGQDSDTVTTDYLALCVDFTAEEGVEYKAVFQVVVTANGSNESETQTVYGTC